MKRDKASPKFEWSLLVSASGLAQEIPAAGYYAIKGSKVERYVTAPETMYAAEVSYFIKTNNNNQYAQ